MTEEITEVFTDAEKVEDLLCTAAAVVNVMCKDCTREYCDTLESCRVIKNLGESIRRFK